jgi:DNA-binding transcriptional regulator YhcF (GntR family)
LSLLTRGSYCTTVVIQYEFRCALHAGAHSPIPIRWQLAEQEKHVIEGGGVPRNQPLPSIRERAGFLDINPNTVTRAIEDLKGERVCGGAAWQEDVRGLDAADTPSPTLREGLLKGTVIRAAALGVTPDDMTVGVLTQRGHTRSCSSKSTGNRLLAAWAHRRTRAPSRREQSLNQER